MEGQAHPYLPRDLKLPGYVPLALSQSTILSIFGASSLLIVSLVWILSGRRSRKLAKGDRLAMCWWAFTGIVHIIIEGYFVFSPEFYKDNTSFYLAEVWKEYSKGDSRYAARDSAVIAVEGLTAVFAGPASLLAIYAIAAGKSYRYILQFGVSLAQLYGTAIYFITPYLDGINYTSTPFYLYAYYIGANASWVVIPSIICIHCWKKICAPAQVQAQKKSKRG